MYSYCFRNCFHFYILLCILLNTEYYSCFLLYTPIDSGGIRGNVTFSQEQGSENIKINIFLTSLIDGPPQQFDWAIHEFPVFFDLKNPCQATELGKSIYDLSRRHGQITIPSHDGNVIEFEDNTIRLQGHQTIWGRSIYFKSTNTSARACSNVVPFGKVKTAIATFTQNVVGTVLFRENELRETMIFSNLFYTLDEYRSGTRNDWKIMVTDILDTNTHHRCNQLHILLDPDNIDETSCSSNDHPSCKMGNMARKHGQIVVGNNNNRYSKKFFIDTSFSFEYLEGSRQLFIIILEKNSNKVMACANITPLKPKVVKSFVNMDGVKGEFAFKQNYKIDPTIITIKLDNLRGRGKFYYVHEFPFYQRKSKNDNLCSNLSVANRHNPFNIDFTLPPLTSTNDQYEVGDLSGKHGTLSEAQDNQNYFNSHVDFNLPLFGVHSIVGRSIVIHKANGDRWICANIGYPEKTVIAKAVFHYPVVGEVIFRQEEDNFNGDTSVLGELFYSDGSVNITHNHAWRVHVNEAGRDFYNWTRRCLSSGDSFNPFSISLGRNYNSQCSSENQLRCQVGDLYLKHKRININTYKSQESTKFFYIDSMLPLSDQNTIIGRSVVIEDDNAPQLRGKRMACSTIRRYHPILATVDNWRFSQAIPTNASGFIELYQESDYDETKGKLNIRGLDKLASGYHIHKVSVPLDKEFPCSGDTVYGHYNPFEVDSSIGPFPAVGSVDEYETGDLSGKFGFLNNLDKEQKSFIDFNLPVRGMNSVIGRSIVIHKQSNNYRWFCGTIQPKVSKNQREIVAIASFDDPRNLVQGYVRFKQIAYHDGSLSDTWIEASLKHKDSNKKVTYGHRWMVYVNSVGSDAFNQIDSVRCLAGGFLWNPYLSKMDEAYKLECNQQNELRCALGDLSGRHGPLSIGGGRNVYSDTNLPFTGNYSIMNRALIIFMNNQSDTALACSNIKLDKHLISNIVIHKIPAFTVAKFMQHMRTLLDAADWLIVAEVQKTKELKNNECVQILVHFYGDDAWRYQSEFNNLIQHGSVRKNINGELIKTYYKSCKSDHTNSSPPNIFLSFNYLIILLSLFLIL